MRRREISATGIQLITVLPVIRRTFNITLTPAQAIAPVFRAPVFDSKKKKMRDAELRKTLIQPVQQTEPPPREMEQ